MIKNIFKYFSREKREQRKKLKELQTQKNGLFLVVENYIYRFLLKI